MQISRSPVHSADVVGARTLTPRMRRVTIRSAAVIGLEIRPAQDVELHLRDVTGRRVKRRYTIRHARPESGEFDLDVLLHGDGPGSTWGATAVPGDTVSFQGPRGKLELRPAAWHLLVGDESALPAIAAITEQVEPAVAVIEVASAADELPLPTGVDAHWVHRGDGAAGTADFLLPVVQALDLGNARDGRAYLMGETRSMVALRAVLEAAGLVHEAIFVKGYWNIGRPDRIAGRTPSSA